MLADEFLLNPDLLSAAVEKLNARLAAAKAPSPEVQYDTDRFEAASTLEELLEEYDYGEPLWNGALMLLAKEMSVAPPTNVTISSIEELTPVESEYVAYFHHGDVTVNGDFGAFFNVWITGNLTVKGVIEASHLDAFDDLMVGGDVRCAAIHYMGSSLIAGTLTAERLAYVAAQGENWVLGGIVTPLLLGEYESNADFDDTRVGRSVDIETEETETIATLLAIDPEEDDEDAFSLLLRAINAVRVNPSTDE